MSQESSMGSVSVSVRVWYMCKFCSVIFPSVDKYCTHKIQQHSIEFSKIGAIVFEESVLQMITTNKTLPPQSNSENDSGDDTQQIFHSDSESETQNAFKIKQEPLDPNLNPNPNPGRVPFGSISESILQTRDENEGEYYSNYYHNDNDNENDDTHSSLASDPDNVDPGQGQDVAHGQDPLAYCDTDGDDPESKPTLFILETETGAEQEFYNEAEGDEELIICLADEDEDDGDCPPSTSLISSPTRSRGNTAASATSKNHIAARKSIIYQCETCSKQFRTAEQLRTHVTLLCDLQQSQGKNKKKSATASAATATGRVPVPVPVPVSGRPVQSRSRFKMYRPRGDRSSMVECSQCSTMIRSCNLKRHIETHAVGGQGNRPFTCQICGCSFRTKSHLSGHFRIHSDARPFPCPYPNCPSTFKSRSSLNSHLKNHYDPNYIL